MNRLFTNPLFTAQNCLISTRVPKGYAQNAYLKKKLSDYYFSRLIPDFYYESKFAWKYSPYVITSRLLYSTVGFFIMYKLCFSRKMSKEIKETKKYKFNIFTKPYLSYEEKVILKEKSNKKKIII